MTLLSESNVWTAKLRLHSACVNTVRGVAIGGITADGAKPLPPLLTPRVKSDNSQLRIFSHPSRSVLHAALRL